VLQKITSHREDFVIVLAFSARTATNVAVQRVAATEFDESRRFTATQWTLVVAAGESRADPQSSRDALAQLCQTYWPPLYAYARGRGYSVHDAQDVTQGFFAFLIAHEIYKRVDRQKGKFRSFLLASFKNYLSDAQDREAALKRGGGREFLPLDETRAEAAESLFQTHHASDCRGSAEDRLFERSWAETLVNTALKRVAAAYEAEGKEELFANLKLFVAVGATPLPAYADLAMRLGITESTLRSHVTRLRARFREILRAEVRRTVASDAEVDAELRELLRVLSHA
jgi:RNA polymerase sigma factor (sigma-70 family)